MLQFVDCVQGRSNLAGSEVPVDPEVHKALCRDDELGLVEVDNDPQLCAQVDEVKARVSEALTIL